MEATHGAARRVGVVHAGGNGTATVLYGLSWLARRRGRHATGVVLGIGGGVVATAGGYLGGHLSLVRKVGTAEPAFEGPPGGVSNSMDGVDRERGSAGSLLNAVPEQGS